mmetsp:Transcript_7073/g.9141  ORF Transcript_7073/g.9141 Transcript_7073/m.9141 type:complete len:183 (-) Transcript_7073:167-715(-)
MGGESLPRHWARRESKTHPGKFFYYNALTATRTWVRPREDAEAPSGKKRKTGAGDNGLGGATCHALHLLVKHKGSRRPSSWREPNISISKDEAQRLLVRMRLEILADTEASGGGPDALEAAFRSRAAKRSDCSSASRGGDLGTFPYGKMQKSFEKAAFALASQEMSGVVETDSGLHLIFRVA